MYFRKQFHPALLKRKYILHYIQNSDNCMYIIKFFDEPWGLLVLNQRGRIKTNIHYFPFPLKGGNIYKSMRLKSFDAVGYPPLKSINSPGQVPF